jgi:hypothetical protein
MYSMQDIKIICRNNKEVYMNKDFIKYINVIRIFYGEDDDDDDETHNEDNNKDYFELKSIDSIMMDLIISICKLREESIEKSNKFIKNLCIKNKFNLLDSVHYLDIEFIENKLYDDIVKLLENKSKDDLENLFNIKLRVN